MADKSSSPAIKALDELNSDTLSKMKVLFTAAHFLGKKGGPYSDFEDLVTYSAAIGVEVGDRYKCAYFIGSCRNYYHIFGWTQLSFFNP